MSDMINKLKEKLLKNARIINNEKKIAKKIEKSLIPSKPVAIPGVSVAYIYKPKKDFGGDFFDFYTSRKIDNTNKFGVLITDSGHGVPGALITSMIKTLFSIESIENKLSYPQKVLEYLNIKLFNQIGDNFVTGQYALIDLDKYFLEISNAGDNPLYLIRKNILQKIEVKGRAIGLFEDSTYITQKVKIEKDDILFFYTDGLTEAINDKEEVFKNKLEEILIKNSNKTSKEINQIILNELKIFTQKEHYDDDIALVTIKIK